VRQHGVTPAGEVRVTAGTIHNHGAHAHLPVCGPGGRDWGQVRPNHARADAGGDPAARGFPTLARTHRSRHTRIDAAEPVL